MFAFGLFGGSGGGGGSTTDLAGIANTAAASGQVYYGGTSGTPVSEAAFAYNPTTDTMSVPNITATTGMTTAVLTATGLIKGKDGTAAAPSISGTNSTNSGLYFSATSTAISVNGSLVSFWDASKFYLYPTGFDLVFAGGGANDSCLRRGGTANSLVYGPATNGSGAAATRTEVNKTITAIADNTATATFTVTVPNGAHSANLEVTLKGSLGAGGAIGANEASASIKYNICIARTAGVNAVAVASAAYGSSGSVAVAGAATCTVTGTVSAISGAVGAANTFTVNVTIARGSGSSSNHTCFAYGVLINDNASGVTIA